MGRCIDADALKAVLSEYLVMGIKPLLRFIDEQPTADCNYCPNCGARMMEVTSDA